jgi:aldehyde:ferredoxin oxidoreductase
VLSDAQLANVLYVDLSTKSHRVVHRPELFEASVGGTGVATALLLEECPQGCDPLSPQSPIIFAVGPLVGLFPMASKTVAAFKSPHTGNLGESHCGGRTAVAIRMAGLGAIVIKGSSDIPVYVAIHGDQVHFRDASTLWGMSSSFTAGRVIRQREPGAGTRTIMRIGRAGERMITYSCLTAETYRHFGRLGLGAVFGSKKLKALVVSGRRSIPVGDVKEYRKLYDRIFAAAVDSPAMKKYHELGTPQNISPLNALGGLPTRNLQSARFDGAERISGEAFADKYLGRRLACAHCPVACVHISALREPHPDEPYFYKTSMISYDYEPVYAMGSMLGVGDPEGLLRLLDAVESAGLDVMSTGPVLSWATEALGEGLVSEKQTGGLKLEWGAVDSYVEAIARIVDGPNEFYRDLGRGVDYAASKYGGEDFAMAFGGNEMPGYHTGPAAHVGYLVGARHSHLDNGGYSLDQKVLNQGELPATELAAKLVEDEAWRQVLSSLVVCFFARKIYDAETTVQALAHAGFEFSAQRLGEFGRRVHREKFRFKRREGFDFSKLRIPGRIFETAAPAGPLTEDYVRRTIACVEELLDS